LRAGFTDLTGILLDRRPEPRFLYVLDGHALRVVDLQRIPAGVREGLEQRGQSLPPGMARTSEPRMWAEVID
jgi:hypothetical protein